ISAMTTDMWSWVRGEIAAFFGRRNDAQVQMESARLEAFALDRPSTAERDLHGRVQGYLETKLFDDPALSEEFIALIGRISSELGLPPVNQTQQQATVSHGVVVQTAGGDAHVSVGQATPAPIQWGAMTRQDAARKLEELDPDVASAAIADMDA